MFCTRRTGEEKEEGTYPTFATPESILVMVAGGSGLFSIVMPNRGGAAIQNAEDSVQVDNNFFCEIHGLAGD